MKNILKKSSFTFLSLASILFAGTLTAGSGTIDVSSATWRAYRSNTETVNISVSSVDNTVSISNADKGSYVWAYLDSPISIAIGETLTISGTATYTSAVSTADNAAFYFGIYNSGSNTVDTPTSSIPDATCGMTGFYAGTRISKTTTTTTTEVDGETVETKETVTTLYSKVFSRFAPKEGSPNAGFMDQGQGGQYITSKDLETIALPEKDVGYDFSLSVSRLEDGYEISYNGTEAVSFSSSESLSAETFDVIAFKCTGSAFTLSNLSYLITIPEPSLFGLFAGTMAIVFAGTRRRRRK